MSLWHAVQGQHVFGKQVIHVGSHTEFSDSLWITEINWGGGYIYTTEIGQLYESGIFLAN